MSAAETAVNRAIKNIFVCAVYDLGNVLVLT